MTLSSSSMWKRRSLIPGSGSIVNKLPFRSYSSGRVVMHSGQYSAWVWHSVWPAPVEHSGSGPQTMPPHSPPLFLSLCFLAIQTFSDLLQKWLWPFRVILCCCVLPGRVVVAVAAWCLWALKDIQNNHKSGGIKQAPGLSPCPLQPSATAAYYTEDLIACKHLKKDESTSFLQRISQYFFLSCLLWWLSGFHRRRTSTGNLINNKCFFYNTIFSKLKTLFCLNSRTLTTCTRFRWISNSI